MTTTVEVSAHCPDNVEVHVSTYDGGNLVDKLIIQDGETTSKVVYDNLRIVVSEVPKSK